MMEPQMRAVTVEMREETDFNNTEEIALVLVVSSLCFRPDVKIS